MTLLDRLRDWLRRLFGRGSPPPPPPPSPPPSPPPGDWRGRMLARHNSERAAAGLPPLRSHPALEGVAQQHAERMAAAGALSHSLGGWPDARVSAAGYAALEVSENAARGQRTADEVVGDWLSSTVGHRDNVLGAFAEAGFGMAAGQDGPYWCAVYANPRA